MSAADRRLPHLPRVKRTAPGKWPACCPAHESKSGSSLSVRELDDGRLLVHCFGGCSVESVLGAIGLDMTDLFPERVAAPGAGTAPQRLRLSASQAIEILERETMIVAVVGGDMVRKKDITEPDHRRLIQAVSRVQFIAQETKR